MKTTSIKYDYIVHGTRENSEVVYYMNKPSVTGWCPNAQDIATGYPDKVKAQEVAEKLKPKYKGLQIGVSKRMPISQL